MNDDTRTADEDLVPYPTVDGEDYPRQPGVDDPLMVPREQHDGILKMRGEQETRPVDPSRIKLDPSIDVEAAQAYAREAMAKHS